MIRKPNLDHIPNDTLQGLIDIYVYHQIGNDRFFNLLEEKLRRIDEEKM